MTRVRAIVGLGLLLWAGCQTGPRFNPRAQPATTLTNFVTGIDTGRIQPGWLEPPRQPYTLGPGDRLQIELLGHDDSILKTFVCPDGKIYYDLLPGLSVAGLTLAETKGLLEQGLAQYYRQPQVIVTLTGAVSKRVWVLGRLNRNGIYPLTGPTTIISAVAQAGGLFTSRFTGTTEELADLEHSFIVRNGQMLPVDFKKLLREGDLSQNIYLQPDDFIYLPSALSKEIYVLGAVMQPRPLGFMDDITLVGAIAKAQGPAPYAYLTHVVIIRGSLTAPKVAFVNYQRIITGGEPDIKLEPRDIIYIPNSPLETVERYIKLILDTYTRTAAINEGGRAASGKFQPSGVSIPVGQ